MASYLPVLLSAFSKLHAVTLRGNPEVSFHTIIRLWLANKKTSSNQRLENGVKATCIGKSGRNLSTRLTKHKRATKKGDLNNNIAKHHLKTSHAIDWYSATCLTYSTDYYQRITNLEQTALMIVNLFPHLRNVYSTGNSNTLFIIHFTSHICITYLCTCLHSQSHHAFTNGYLIYWPIKSLTKVFEFSTD